MVFVLNLLLVDGVVGVNVPIKWIIYMQKVGTKSRNEVYFNT